MKLVRFKLRLPGLCFRAQVQSWATGRLSKGPGETGARGPPPGLGLTAGRRGAVGWTPLGGRRRKVQLRAPYTQTGNLKDQRLSLERLFLACAVGPSYLPPDKKEDHPPPSLGCPGQETPQGEGPALEPNGEVQTIQARSFL